MLHTGRLAGVKVTTGDGFTRIVAVWIGPTQLLAVGVTVMVAVTPVLPVLTAPKALMLPEPVAARLMLVVLLLQV